MGNFTWSGKERVQEPTVYQTELVFHATRCKQIYLIRTPCSYCIQTHFLYRQKEKKKSFGSKFLQYYKKISKLCVSLIKLDFFFFFLLILVWTGISKSGPHITKMICGPSTHIPRYQFWFETLPFYFISGDNRCVVIQGEAGPWSNVFRSCIPRPEIQPQDLLPTPRPWDPHSCSTLVQSVKVSPSCRLCNPETLMNFTSLLLFSLLYKVERNLEHRQEEKVRLCAQGLYSTP